MEKQLVRVRPAKARAMLVSEYGGVTWRKPA